MSFASEPSERITSVSYHIWFHMELGVKPRASTQTNHTPALGIEKKCNEWMNCVGRIRVGMFELIKDQSQDYSFRVVIKIQSMNIDKNISLL